MEEWAEIEIGDSNRRGVLGGREEEGGRGREGREGGEGEKREEGEGREGGSNWSVCTKMCINKILLFVHTETYWSVAQNFL